jgi:hypothetical protein
MHVLNMFGVVVLAVVLTATRTNGQYHGILINGQQGTQLYDPFNTPHVQGYLEMGLAMQYAAQSGAAVINGQLAYFGSSSTSSGG